MPGEEIDWRECLANNGFAVIGIPEAAQPVDAVLAALDTAFANDASGSTLRTGDGAIYGARNLLQLWPGVADAWKQPPLPTVLRETLGPCYGLVRVLYFDKPPEQSWALPWHKDAAIAVQDNRLPSVHFSKPTVKIGVPHVDAPEWLLFCSSLAPPLSPLPSDGPLPVFCSSLAPPLSPLPRTRANPVSASRAA